MMTLQKAVSIISGEQQQQLLYLRAVISTECPNIFKALRLINEQYTTPKSPKGYNLVKRENMKLGFVYYVRYWHEGKMIPSKWCTHTNDYKTACEFAVKNKERLIARYLGKNGGEVERFFMNFYKKDNPIFQSEFKRNLKISEDKRKRFVSIINKRFIPFLSEKKIRIFDEITVPVLNDFQDVLLAGGLKAQSVNVQLVAVKKVMAYLSRKGTIKDNPCLRLSPVPLRKDERKTHGCYELPKLKGVFDKEWDDKRSYILNLLIYSTGMRNGEIKSFSKNDIITIFDCHFIDVKKSKTENGIRLVPLHEKVFKALLNYWKDKKEDKPIIHTKNHRIEEKASDDLGIMLGVNKEYLKKNNITFYSGRHAWKTMMNAGGLGENAEELFIGHRVTSDVKKLYNHKDKQGQEQLVKKAKEIFRILDTLLFASGE